MSVQRVLPLILLLLLSASPVVGQPASADSITLSGESIRALHDAVATLDQELNDPSGTQAPANTAERSPERDRTAIAEVLFLFLVLSLVFESAMSAIFDWRLYIRYFEGRGVKTPLLVTIAFLVCMEYNLDIVHDLLAALGETGGSETTAGQFFTALLIAGGSGGVFRIFSHLGIRSPEERDRRAREERAAHDTSEVEDESEAPS